MRCRIYLAGLAILFIGKSGIAQKSLSEIPDDLATFYKQRKAVAIDYALEHDLPIRQVFADGTVMEIQFLDESGKPLYYKTMNAEAAATTATDQLYEGSDLGLALSGKGIKVGIWDAGLVLSSHIEFEGRAQIVEGSEVAEHATHVTGTILAKGINQAAKGMAFAATSLNYDGLNGDTPEMKKEAEKGLLLSNHSYGAVLGWNYNSANNSWEWFGDASVSSLEDYRFGFYSTESAIWDDIAYNYPYYLIVKAAGNDRNDTGNGTGAPADGPYDIIGPQGVAKNVLTVGSVNPLTGNYTSPDDISIAPYSSWGPTDDGRIKPDLVGMGQNVLSTSAAGDDQYSTLSGTSMAAPNVCGSLALIQQLYYQQKGKYLSSAALKALAIHTAYEAGTADGPDYQFGWGLLNSEGVAKMLLLDGRAGFFIIEDSLADGEVYTIALDGVSAGQKLTATLVWTDPPGLAETTATVDPENIKLINDLDLRIVDSSDSVYLPWAMNPDTKQAYRGDNFRDNVEKIQALATLNGNYTLQISHKDSLFNGKQNFALVVSIGDLNNELNSFYFVGSSQNLLDSTNWSDSSGGLPVNKTPGPNDIVIFDDNSLDSLNTNELILNQDFSCFSLAASGSLPLVINLNSNKLSIERNIVLTNKNFELQNGKLIISPTGPGFIKVADKSLVNIALHITGGKAPSNLLSDLEVDTLSLSASVFNSNGFTITSKTVNVDSSAIVSFANSLLTGLNFFIVKNNSMLDADNTTLVFDGIDSNKMLIGQLNEIGTVKQISGVLTIVNLQRIDSLIVTSSLVVEDSLTVGNADILPGASLFVREGQEVFLEKTINISSSEANRVAIGVFPQSSTLSGSIRSNYFPKFCFDFVDVANIAVTGDSRFVVGPNSTLVNASGWLQNNCQDVLAADFSYQYTCSGGITYFTDLSDGNPDSWLWDFGDGVTSSEKNPGHKYSLSGSYVVKLTVGEGVETSTFSREITISEPNISKPSIVLENNQLRATAFAPNYQWYLDNTEIAGANDYYLSDFSVAGAYHIEIWNADCRLASEPFLITGLNQSDITESVYPNPFDEKLYIENTNNVITEILILDYRGTEIISKTMNPSKGNIVLDTSWIKPGFYYLVVVKENERRLWKIVKL